jgi:hypothetical protein
MQDEKKRGFFQKLFGKKSSCCSLEFEAIDSDEKKPTATTATGGDATHCCASSARADKNRSEG